MVRVMQMCTTRTKTLPVLLVVSDIQGSAVVDMHKSLIYRTQVQGVFVFGRWGDHLAGWGFL